MLGENIRLLREERHMTLSKLATLSGISPGYLSDIEKGNKTSPSMDILKSIADALDTTSAALLKELKDDNWKNSLDKMKSREEKIKYLESIVDFADPKDAVQFLLKQPSVMGFGGFDVNQMSDDEVVEFANELLRQLKLISYKYKK